MRAHPSGDLGSAEALAWPSHPCPPRSERPRRPVASTHPRSLRTLWIERRFRLEFAQTSTDRRVENSRCGLEARHYRAPPPQLGAPKHRERSVKTCRNPPNLWRNCLSSILRPMFAAPINRSAT